MEYVTNEQETQTKINESAAWNDKQKQENDRTIQRYESLSYFEREEILTWLKQNLTSIPILAKTKKQDYQSLSQGNTGRHRHCYSFDKQCRLLGLSISYLINKILVKFFKYRVFNQITKD
jgi:hypothetical protein